MHTEHSHHVNGLHIHSYSAGAGEPVVFLHGWSVHAGSTRHLRELLAKQRQVLTPSLIGHGKSQALPRPDFGVRDFGKVYADWMLHLGLQDASLIGHSFGGAVAMVAAAQLPAGVLRKLILIDPLGAPIARTAAGWNVQWLQKEMQNVVHAPHMYMQNVVKPFGYNLTRNTRDLFRLADECKRLDVREEAKNIQVPVTILWGEQDNFVPMSVGEELVAAIPQATLHRLPGVHDWPLLRPEALVAFLGK